MTEPPTKRRRLVDADEEPGPGPASLIRSISPPKRQSAPQSRKLLPSPFRLTTIRDLPPESNVEAVSLGDLLGDPLISECWEFNYLHDVDFLMSHFDEDTRSLVKVHIVHGFWKREDPNRLALGVSALSIFPCLYISGRSVCMLCCTSLLVLVYIPSVWLHGRSDHVIKKEVNTPFSSNTEWLLRN